MRAVRAPGKAIICGEYAVLDGAPAISVAVDRYVRASTRTDHTAPTTSPFVEAALRHTARALDVPISRFDTLRKGLFVDSTGLYEQKEKLGLGSSAAVTAAVVGLALNEADQSFERAFAIADAAHAEAQGVAGSGIDVATSVHGGAIRFQRVDNAPVIASVAWPSELQLTFVFSGQSASTPDLVGRVRRLRERDAARYRSCMSVLARLATDFAAALARADSSAAVSAIADWQPALAELGRAADAPIVTPFFETLARIARTHGGAAKPSGAGGGDLGFVLSADDLSTAAIRKALSSEGISVLSLCERGPASGLSLET